MGLSMFTETFAGMILFILGFCIALNGLMKIKSSIIEPAVFISGGVLVVLFGISCIYNANYNKVIEPEKQITSKFDDIDKCNPISKTIIEDDMYIYCQKSEIFSVDSETYNHYSSLPVVDNENIFKFHDEKKRFDAAIHFFIISQILLIILYVLFIFYKRIRDRHYFYGV